MSRNLCGLEGDVARGEIDLFNEPLLPTSSGQRIFVLDNDLNKRNLSF